LPENLDKDTTHRYGPNTFKLHRYLCLCVFRLGMFLCNCNQYKNCNCNCRLPAPKPGQVLGLVGTNGIGKTTALKVLAGKLKPNLGRFTVRTKSSIFFKMWTDMFKALLH
jgi:ATP-binding cassette subfamily E protein 1